MKRPTAIYRAASAWTFQENELSQSDSVAPEIEEPSPSPAIPVTSPLSALELILKRNPQMNDCLRSPARQGELVLQFLWISIACYLMFGIALAVVFSSLRCWPVFESLTAWGDNPTRMPFHFEWRDANQPITMAWLDGSAIKLIAAYTFGLIAAIGLCLPSFYFFVLLAMMRSSMLEVAAHAMRCLATTGVALLGILPIYTAIVLGVRVFGVEGIYAEIPLHLGLILPFVAGPFGIHALYSGFVELASQIPVARRGSRQLLLGRLLLMWSAIYMVLAPVLVHTVWEYISRS